MESPKQDRMAFSIASRLGCAALFLSMLSASAFAQAQTPSTFDLFYLAVGNSHYAASSQPNGFKNLPGANNAAKTVAETFSKAGAVAGITLVSEEKRFVTKRDVLRALNDLLRQIRNARVQQPLLIFYFCGHGVSEGIGWSHFSIPGDFDAPDKAVNIGMMMEYSIHPDEILSLVATQKIPVMLLLDTCYDGEQPELPDAIFSKQLAQNLTEIFRAMRYANEFHGPAITVFSTAPGTVVPVVQDPFDRKAPLVGPLARRLLICFAAAFNRQNPLLIGDFLETLSNKRFDPKTRSVVTNSVPEKADVALIKYPLTEATRGESRIGSGKKKRLAK